MSACKKKANESKISTKSTSLDLGKSEGFEAESVWTGCGGPYDEKKDYARARFIVRQDCVKGNAQTLVSYVHAVKEETFCPSESYESIF